MKTLLIIAAMLVSCGTEPTKQVIVIEDECPDGFVVYEPSPDENTSNLDLELTCSPVEPNLED